MSLLPLVEDILRYNDKARESDRELLIQVMQRRGVNLSASQIDKLRDINFETITRIRRKLNEQGKYLPSVRTAKARHLKSLTMQQNAPVADAKRLEDLSQQAIPWIEY